MLSNGAADPPRPMIEARLASIVIPDPSEMPVFLPETPLENRSNQHFEAAGDFLPKVEDFAPWEFSLLFASIEEAENEISSQATEEIPALFAENNRPQTDGILPVEKKRISSAQKPSTVRRAPCGNEPLFGDLGPRKRRLAIQANFHPPHLFQRQVPFSPPLIFRKQRGPLSHSRADSKAWQGARRYP